MNLDQILSNTNVISIRETSGDIDPVSRSSLLRNPSDLQNQELVSGPTGNTPLKQRRK
jgi:DNA helicase TIP49 (TBP-interacting protein)